MKVLVYGYGWSGQSAFKLFTHLGYEVSVVDDKLDLDFTEDSRFIAYESMLESEFALYLVCVVDDEIFTKMSLKLQKSGVSQDRIKRVQTYAYTEKMRYLLSEFFNAESIVSQLLKESCDLPLFHKTIHTMQQRYFADKREIIEGRLDRKARIESKLEEKTSFARIYATTLDKSTLAHIAYPGFNIGFSSFKQEDKDFYFVKKIDFESLKKRPKHIKLVACFGNSALRVEYLPYQNTITAYLQELLGDSYLVLNFGVTGYTLYEQMMLYMALAHTLKPEIVMAFFAGTDYRAAPMACDTLLKEHYINYTPWFYENTYRKFTGSEIPLLIDFGLNASVVNPKISYAEVNNAMKERLMQFKDCVGAGGGGHSLPLSSLSCRLRSLGVRKSA